MLDIVKICKIHGNLRAEDCYLYKSKNRYSCKKCTSNNADKWYKLNKDKKKNNRIEYYQKNKEKINAYSMNWQRLNSEKRRIQRKYQNHSLNQCLGNIHITKDQYLKMEKEQENKCKICKRQFPLLDKDGNYRRLQIDHCHKTGKIRSLLCNRCNLSIGRLEKQNKNINFKYINQMKEYLSFHSSV